MSEPTSGDVWAEHGRQREMHGFDSALAIVYGRARGAKNTMANQLYAPSIRRKAKAGLAELKEVIESIEEERVRIYGERRRPPGYLDRDKTADNKECDE